MGDSWYWDIEEPMSYGCLMNYIMGIRGVGKTYTSLLKHVDMAAKDLARGVEPRRFMYLRRYETELEKLTACQNGRLFAKHMINGEFKGHEVKAGGNEIFYDGELIGYAQSLTRASLLKSDAVVNVRSIIFDEFTIKKKGTYRYLRDEVNDFFDLYETVARGEKDVQCWFLGNTTSIQNPYFDYFKLEIPKAGGIQRFGTARDILVQNADSKALGDYKKATRFGKLVEGSEWSDFAYSNEWLDDNFDFIEQKPGRSKYYCTLLYNDKKIGIWYDPRNWRFFISNDYDETFPRVFAATTDDHKPNIMLFKSAKKMEYVKKLIEAYQFGCVRYESLQLKSSFREVMRMVYL